LCGNRTGVGFKDLGVKLTKVVKKQRLYPIDCVVRPVGFGINSTGWMFEFEFTWLFCSGFQCFRGILVVERGVNALNDDPNPFWTVISSADAVYQRSLETYPTRFGIIRGYFGCELRMSLSVSNGSWSVRLVWRGFNNQFDTLNRSKRNPTPVYGVGFLKVYEIKFRVVHFKSTQRTDGFYLEFEPPATGNLFVFYLRPYQKFHYHIQTMVNTFGDNTLGIPYKVPTFFH